MKCRKCQEESPYLSPWHLCLRCEGDRINLQNTWRSIHNLPDGVSCNFDRDRYKPSNIGGSLDQENAEKPRSAMRDMNATDEKSLALASWCAGSVIKQPCEPVPVTYAPGAHGPDARRRVHRSAARLPARPRPVPLVATNSSPGVCSVPTPPSRCISPPVCSRSITPPVAVAGSRGCTLSASPGTR